MIGFDFQRPQWLWLTLFALVILALGFFSLTRRRQALARLVVASQLGRFLPGFSRNRAVTRVMLAAGATFFLAVSVVGPVRGYTFQPVSSRGLDLVVCIDTSRSMLAQDLRPSRLERARREVAGLLDRLRGDRVALIAFSGDAREIAPLTHDRTTLLGLLDFVSPEDNQLGGTDLSAALSQALSLFDGRTGSHEAICLLTDGEDLEGRAAELAAAAAEAGIRVYIVGIGTEGGGKIPTVGPDGRGGFLTGPDGAEVVTRLDGTTLERLAQTTGGYYLSTEQSPTPLEDLYSARISKLEGRDLEGGKRRIPHDRFQWTLVLAVLCMGAEVGLRERRLGAERQP